MYFISKEFEFSASHVLSGLPPGHPCGRLHGHNYRVKVILRAEVLNDVGFVVDYGDLNEFKQYLDANLDHRHLNAVFSFQPSAENLAHYLFTWCVRHWPQTWMVEVSETGKTWAGYALSSE